MGAFGPIYLNSAKQSILNGVLKSTPVGNSGLASQPKSGTSSPDALLAVTSQLPQRLNWFGEPTGELDPENRAVVLGLLLAHAAKSNIVVVASDDPEVLSALPQVVELRRGEVEAVRRR